MATRHGWEYAQQLAKRGWEIVPLPGDQIDDPQVKDPITGSLMSPHNGIAVQANRDRLSEQGWRFGSAEDFLK